jgi:hypothetical protein
MWSRRSSTACNFPTGRTAAGAIAPAAAALPSRHGQAQPAHHLARAAAVDSQAHELDRGVAHLPTGCAFACRPF